MPIQAVFAAAWAGVMVGGGAVALEAAWLEDSFGSMVTLGIGVFVATWGIVDLVKAIRQWLALCGMVSQASKGCNTPGCAYERFGPLDHTIGFCPGCGIEKKVQRKGAKNVVH